MRTSPGVASRACPPRCARAAGASVGVGASTLQTAAGLADASLRARRGAIRRPAGRDGGAARDAEALFRTVKVEGTSISRATTPTSSRSIIQRAHRPGLVLVTAEPPSPSWPSPRSSRCPSSAGWRGRCRPSRLSTPGRRRGRGPERADLRGRPRGAHGRRGLALFPEGISHDARTLLPLKTGAARIALGAARRSDTPLRLSLVPTRAAAPQDPLSQRRGLRYRPPSRSGRGHGRREPPGSARADRRARGAARGARGGSRVEAAAAFGEAVRRAFADEDAPVVGQTCRRGRRRPSRPGWGGHPRWPGTRTVGCTRCCAAQRPPRHADAPAMACRRSGPRASAWRAVRARTSGGAGVGAPRAAVPGRRDPGGAAALRGGQDLDSTVKVLASMLFGLVGHGGRRRRRAGPVWGAGCSRAPRGRAGGAPLRRARLGHGRSLVGPLRRRRLSACGPSGGAGRAAGGAGALPGSAVDDGGVTRGRGPAHGGSRPVRGLRADSGPTRPRSLCLRRALPRTERASTAAALAGAILMASSPPSRRSPRRRPRGIPAGDAPATDGTDRRRA